MQNFIIKKTFDYLYEDRFYFSSTPETTDMTSIAAPLDRASFFLIN